MHVTDEQVAGVLRLVRGSKQAAFDVYADLTLAKRTRQCTPRFLALYHTVKEIVDAYLSPLRDQ